MTASIPLGKQHLYMAIEKLGTLVPKQSLSLSVYQDNNAARVDHEHGVRCSLNHEAQLLLIT